MKLNWMIVMLLIITINSKARADDIVDIDKGASYLSSDIHQMAVELTSKYPDILEMESLGKSYDGKPVYALRLSKNISNFSRDVKLNVAKSHYLVEAGTHARETFNPVLVMKEIELYCKDYDEETTIPEFDMHDMLDSSVIHFLPLTNPDGFDLVKKGEISIRTPRARESISRVTYIDKNYYKAGIRGVDFNRNYPSRYFDIEEEKWIDLWNKYPSDLYTQEPSWAYFHGNKPASEIEVRIVMNYVDRYDFRNFLSYHSQGQVLYWHQYYFSNRYNERAKSLANIFEKVTGYELMKRGNGIGSGYLSDYTTHSTLKPIVVVETINPSANRPTPQSYYRSAYDKNKLLPLYAVREGQRVGYHKYRLYVDGLYKRDFEEYIYARAHQIELGGLIIEGEGVPEFKIEIENE